jgi:UDP-glucose 4-epimerase
MKVCIIGASGLIGMSLVKRLACQPDMEITAFDRVPQPAELPVRWLQGDLQNPDDCERLVKNQDVIFHLAHTNSPLTSDQDMVQDTIDNLLPTLKLLKAIEKENHTPHLIYPSSGGAVYGLSESKRRFKENDSCFPTSSYGIQKLIAEHYIRLGADRGSLTAIVLRIANAYGWLLPPDRSQGFIGTAVTRVLQNQSIRIFGNPQNVRDYVHINDILDAIVLAATQRKSFEIYNIGTGTGTSVIEIVRIIERLLGRPVEYTYIELEQAKLLNNWCVLDTDKALHEMSWKSKISLEEGIHGLLG